MRRTRESLPTAQVRLEGGLFIEEPTVPPEPGAPAMPRSKGQVRGGAEIPSSARLPGSLRGAPQTGSPKREAPTAEPLLEPQAVGDMGYIKIQGGHEES